MHKDTCINIPFSCVSSNVFIYGGDTPFSLCFVLLDKFHLISSLGDLYSPDHISASWNS